MRDFDSRLKQAQATLCETSFPKQVIIETTAICNLRCPACPSRLLDRPRGKMSAELFRKIIDEIAAEAPDTEIYPAYMGEALGHPRLFEDLAYAVGKGIRTIILNTNAMLLNEVACAKLVAGGILRVIISIDGHSAETYEARRVGGKYEKVVENTLRLLGMVRKAGSPLEVWVQLIVDEENGAEEKPFTAFWLAEGANVKVRPQLTWGGRVGGRLLSTVTLERVPCAWLMRQIVVTWNGHVALCDADHEAKLHLGDITRQSIKEVWDGPFRRLQEAHMAGDFSHPLCAGCEDWKVGKSEVSRPERPSK